MGGGLGGHQHLMAMDLTTRHPVPPEGYAVTVETVGAVTHVRVPDAADGQAAKGQVAAVVEVVVVDQVQTQEAHRRRGPGALVMCTLADRAVEEGATLGVLGATDAGRALYESLGWKRHPTLAECVYSPEVPQPRRRPSRPPEQPRPRAPLGRRQPPPEPLLIESNALTSRHAPTAPWAAGP